MFSELEFRDISLMFRLGSVLQLFPVNWDSEKGNVHLSQSLLKRFLTRFLAWWHLIYAGISCIRLFITFDFLFPCDRSLKKYIFHLLMSMAYLGGSIESFLFNYKAKEAFYLFHQLVLFNRKFGIRLLKREYLKNDFEHLRKLCLEAFALTMSFMMVVLFVLEFVWPDACLFTTSIYMRAFDRWTYVGLFLTLYDGVHVILSGYTHVLTVYYLIYYFTLINFWIRILCTNSSSCLKISNTEYLLLYRILHIFILIFTDVFAETVVPALITIGFLGTSLSAYGVVHLYGKLSLVYYSFLPLFMVIGYANIMILFMLMSPAYEYSKNFQRISAFVTKEESFPRLHKKVIRKKLIACRPLRHSVANLYIVKAGSKIESLGFLINLIAYLLLT